MTLRSTFVSVLLKSTRCIHALKQMRDMKPKAQECALVVERERSLAVDWVIVSCFWLAIVSNEELHCMHFCSSLSFLSPIAPGFKQTTFLSEYLNKKTK